MKVVYDHLPMLPCYLFCTGITTIELDQGLNTINSEFFISFLFPTAY